jgi:arylsulfatase A-like enzyme
MEAHRPFLPSEAHRLRIMPPEQVARSYEIDRSWLPMWSFVFGLHEYSKEDLAIMAATYDATLAELDDLFHALLESLRAKGLLDNTVIVLTSDHGEHLGEHGLLGHNLSIANTLLHVPLIVRFPKLVDAGLRIDEPVEIRRIGALVDLVLSRAPDARLSARELVSALSGRTDGAVISEADRPLIRRVEPEEIPDEPRFQRRRKSVIVGDLKYVWSSDGMHELYDLRADPGEERNLLPGRSHDREMLQGLLESEPGLWREHAADPDLLLSEEAREQLREMGYLPDPRPDPDR